MKDDVLQALADLGCWRIWIGAESGSQRILDAMERGVTVEQVLFATQAAKRHGIQVGMFLMWGYEGETVDDIAATVELVRRADPDIFLTTVSYPIKNTPYFNALNDRVVATRDWAAATDRDYRCAAATRGRFTRMPTAGSARMVASHRLGTDGAAARHEARTARAALLARSLAKVGDRRRASRFRRHSDLQPQSVSRRGRPDGARSDLCRPRADRGGRRFHGPHRANGRRHRRSSGQSHITSPFGIAGARPQCRYRASPRPLHRVPRFRQFMGALEARGSVWPHSLPGRSASGSYGPALYRRAALPCLVAMPLAARRDGSPSLTPAKYGRERFERPRVGALLREVGAFDETFVWAKTMTLGPPRAAKSDRLRAGRASAASDPRDQFHVAFPAL